MEWKKLQNLTFVLLQVRTKHTSVSRRFSVEIWELRIENWQHSIWLPEFDMCSVLSFKHVTFWWTEKKIFHIYLYKLLIIVEFVQFMRSCSLNWIMGSLTQSKQKSISPMTILNRWIFAQIQQRKFVMIVLGFVKKIICYVARKKNLLFSVGSYNDLGLTFLKTL